VAGVFDNITIQDNEIASTNTNGHVQLKPDGTGSVEIIQDTPTTVDLTDEEVPAIIGAIGAQHLEFDDDTMQSKSNATTAGALNLNRLGGNVNIGAAGSVTAVLGTNAIDLTDANSAFRVGTGAGVHIEMALDDIQSKSNATTAAQLNINPLGGDVFVGAQSGSGLTALFDDGVPIVVTGNGLIQLRSVGDTDTEVRQILFTHQDATLRGFVGYGGDANINLENRINSGHLLLTARDSGAVPRVIANADPDGITQLRGHTGINLTTGDAGELGVECLENSETRLYHNGDKRLTAGTSGGVAIFADGTGNLINRIQFAESTGGLKGVIGFDTASDVFTVANEINGGNLVLSAEQVGGAQITGFTIDPDGSTVMNCRSGGTIRGEVNGVLVWDASAGFAFYSSGTFEGASHDHTASGNTSGLGIEDGEGGFRNVGFNEATTSNQSGAYTFLRAEVGQLIRNTSTIARTWTIPNSNADIPNGSMWLLMNNATGAITIEDGTNTLTFFDGTGTPATGNRNFQNGGIATLWKRAANVFSIWGNAALS